MDQAPRPPRYSMLAEELRARIEAGEWQAGDRLPSEAELCTQSGVSRGTVVRAIAQLVDQGFVTRRQGAGSFVASRSLHRKAGQLLSFTETVRRDGHDTRQSLIEFRDAEPGEARQFGLSGPVKLLRRIRYVDATPCAVHGSLLPVWVCHRVAALDPDNSKALKAPDFSLYRAFGDAGLDIREARERLTARLATAEECTLLDLRAPAAVIVVLRMSYVENGDLIEAVEAVYRADYYTYDAHLVRGHRDATQGPRLAASSEGYPG